MKILSKHNVRFLIGLLLSVPAAYFILISVLKYGFGYDYLFDLSWPTLQRLGVQESIGWNINLLILIGPVLALLLNVVSIVDVRFNFSKDKIDCQFSIIKRWRNLAVVFFSSDVLFVLTGYLFLENCNCLF